MAHVVRIESRLPYDDTFTWGPYAINTWHVSYNPLVADVLDSPEATAESARNGIIEYFTWLDEDDVALQGFMSPLLTGHIEFKWWDLDETTPVAHDMADGTFTPGTNDPLPTQVALCQTTKCDPYGGHRRQSFYNRQYIGPFNIAALENDTGASQEALRLRMLRGLDQYGTHFDDLTVDYAHPCVYSTKHDSSGLITAAWVDDRFDIQRRRASAINTKTHL